MNVRGLVGALLPVFFVLALGYLAGKRRSFDAETSASFLVEGTKPNLKKIKAYVDESLMLVTALSPWIRERW